MPETQVRLKDEYYAAIHRTSEWSGKSYTEIVRQLVLWLDSVDEEIAGPIIGALPKRLRPDFARMVLEHIASENAGEEIDLLAEFTPSSEGEQPESDAPQQPDAQPQERKRQPGKRPTKRQR